MADQTYARTLGEARLDARFHAILQALNAKLFRRLKILFAVITLFSGTAAASLLWHDNREIGAVAGAALAILAILDYVLDPAACAAAHNEWAKRWGELVARRDLETLAAYDSEIDKLRANERDVLETLAAIAYNRNVAAAGYESWKIRLTPWQRVLALLV